MDALGLSRRSAGRAAAVEVGGLARGAHRGSRTAHEEEVRRAEGVGRGDMGDEKSERMLPTAVLLGKVMSLDSCLISTPCSLFRRSVLS